MRTIKELKQELDKFPDDAVCFAYEREVIGLIVERKDDRLKNKGVINQGVIYCSEGNSIEELTELF